MHRVSDDHEFTGIPIASVRFPRLRTLYVKLERGTLLPSGANPCAKILRKLVGGCRNLEIFELAVSLVRGMNEAASYLPSRLTHIHTWCWIDSFGFCMLNADLPWLKGIKVYFNCDEERKLGPGETGTINKVLSRFRDSLQVINLDHVKHKYPRLSIERMKKLERL